MDFVHMSPIAERLREPVRAALRGAAGNWPDPLTLDERRALGDHGIVPLVYAAAQLPQLRSDAICAAALEPLRAADVGEVLAALTAAGVDALLLKGTALAYQIYPAPELRPRGDTDLLIPRGTVDLMRRTMRSIGFAERLTSGDEHGVRQTMFTRTGPLGVEHAYDVHWAVANNAVFDALLPFEDIRPRSVAIPALGPHARGLSRVDALLLACIHRVAHHHDSDRLIWLADIALLREAMTEEEHGRFWHIAAAGRVVALCVRSISLADEWMSRERRHGAERWLPDDEIERHEPSHVFLDREITYGRVMVASLRALSWRARLQRVTHLALPPPAFMRQTFGDRRPLSLMYLLRAVRGVARLFRKVGAR